MQEDDTTRQIIGEVDNPARTPVKMDVPQFVIIMGAAAIGAVVGPCSVHQVARWVL